MPDEFRRDLLDLLPNLRRFALLLCGSADAADEADDMVRMTCRRALADRRAFRRGSRLDVDLFRILYSKRIAGKGREHETGVMSDRAAPPDRDGPLDRMLGAIEGLPGDRRAMLLLVCAEGLSYRQAADILQMPIGTVIRCLSGARKRLAAHLGLHGVRPRSAGKETSMRGFDHEILMAFADGEIDEKSRRAIEKAMDADEELVDCAALFIRTAALSKQALDPLLDRPVPEALRAGIAAMTQVRQPTPLGFSLRWTMVLAAAASLVAAALAGFLIGWLE